MDKSQTIRCGSRLHESAGLPAAHSCTNVFSTALAGRDRRARNVDHRTSPQSRPGISLGTSASAPFCCSFASTATFPGLPGGAYRAPHALIPSLIFLRLGVASWPRRPPRPSSRMHHFTFLRWISCGGPEHMILPGTPCSHQNVVISYHRNRWLHILFSTPKIPDYRKYGQFVDAPSGGRSSNCVSASRRIFAERSRRSRLVTQLLGLQSNLQAGNLHEDI